MSTFAPTRPPEPVSTQLTTLVRKTTPWWLRVTSRMAPLAFSIPFIFLAMLTSTSDFASIEHTHAVMDALVARDGGDLEQLGRNAPPLIALIAYISPWLPVLHFIAALAAGTATWVVWKQLSEINLPIALRTLLTAGFASAPAVLFLSSAQASEMITVLLLLVAWRLYLRFVSLGITWNGFAAGLVLALAFFCDFASIFYVIPFAISAPATLFRNYHVPRAERFRANITGFLVIALPAIFAFVGWCYVDYIITGNPFAFSSNNTATRFLDADNGLSLFVGAGNALQATLGDLARVPLYVLVGILLLGRNRRALLAYLFPLALTIVVRIWGLPHGESFALGTYLGFALIGIVTAMSRSAQRFRPSRVERFSRNGMYLFIAAAAVLQIGVNFTTSLRTDEAKAWQNAVLEGRPLPESKMNGFIAARLAELPARSVLADDNAFAVIARERTVKPYVLPSDARFQFARSAPTEWVDHVLVRTDQSAYDNLYRQFSGDVDGFYVDIEWPGWRLLTKIGATPVVR